MNFYDKYGNDLNLVTKNGVPYGTLFFQRISVGLIGVEHIYVLDKDNNKVDVTVSLEQNDINYNTFNVSSNEIVNNILNFTGQINISVESEIFGIYNNTLNIFKDNVKVAVINLEIEILDEDKRFDELLKTLYNPDIIPNENDMLAYRDMDTKNSVLDWNKVNKHRKELLLLGTEIFPYLGSDKALINMIYHFGYTDVDVNEIWKNINPESKNYDKIKKTLNTYQSSLRGETSITNFKGKEDWKKTNNINLAYKINKETGEYDEDGLPIVENNFEYTNDEVIIKFNKLFKYLNDKFLPLNVKLHSITGDGVYFENIYIRTFQELTPISKYDLDLVVEIVNEDEDKIFYIEDIRDYDETRFETYDLDESKPISTYSKKPINLANKILYNEVKESKISTKTNSNIYEAESFALINLEIGGLFDRWSDFGKTTFKSIIDSFPNVTFSSLKFGDKYECEWRLINKTDHPNYVYSVRGSIDKFYKHTAKIPYVGVYDIELIVWDLCNNRGYERIDAYADVKMLVPNINIFTIKESMNYKLSDINTSKISDLNGTWHNPFYAKTKGTDLRFKFNSIHPNSFIHNENYRLNSCSIKEFNRDEKYFLLDDIEGDTSFLNDTKVLYEYNTTETLRNVKLNSVSFEDGYCTFNDITNTEWDIIRNNKCGKILFYGIEDWEDAAVGTYYIDDAKLILAPNSSEVYFNKLFKFNISNNDGEYIKTIEVFIDDVEIINSEYVVDIGELIYEIDSFINSTEFVVNVYGIIENNNSIITSWDESNNKVNFTPTRHLPYDELYIQVGFYETESFIDVFSYNSDTNKLFMLDVDKYDNLSCGTKLYWSDVHTNLEQLENNTYFESLNYYNPLDNDNQFYLTVNIDDEFQSKFLHINETKQLLTTKDDLLKTINDKINYYTNTLGLTYFNKKIELYNLYIDEITPLNDIDYTTWFLNSEFCDIKNFYFIRGVSNNLDSIKGIKKYKTDDNIYTIETFDGLYVNEDFNHSLVVHNPVNKFNFGLMDFTDDTLNVNANIDVFFTLDETKTVGLLGNTTKISKDGLVVFETNLNNFKYSFDTIGYYSFEVITIDKNSNTKTTNLSNLINVT